MFHTVYLHCVLGLKCVGFPEQSWSLVRPFQISDMKVMSRFFWPATVSARKLAKYPLLVHWLASPLTRLQIWVSTLPSVRVTISRLGPLEFDPSPKPKPVVVSAQCESAGDGSEEYAQLKEVPTLVCPTLCTPGHGAVSTKSISPVLHRGAFHSSH